MQFSHLRFHYFKICNLVFQYIDLIKQILLEVFRTPKRSRRNSTGRSGRGSPGRGHSQVRKQPANRRNQRKTTQKEDR